MKIFATPDPAHDPGIPIPVPEALHQYIIPVPTGSYTCLQYDFGYIISQQIPVGLHRICRFFVISHEARSVYASHDSPYMGILYNTRGQYRIQIGTQTIHTKAGDYGPYYSPADVHTLEVPAGVSGALLVFLHPDELLNSIAAFSPSVQQLLDHLHTGNNESKGIGVLRMNNRVRENIERMAQFEEKLQPPELYFQGILYNLVTELTRQLHVFAIDRQEAESPRERVQKVHDFIVAQPNLRTCTMEHLSQLAGLGEANLRKLFRQLYQQPVQQFVRQQCLRKAAGMLLESATMRIEDIAFEIGYANQANLSNAFKAAYGVYPREYRKTMGLQ